MNTNWENYYEKIYKTIIKAGDITLKYYRKLQGFDYKGDVDLVTIADKESEDFITGSIYNSFPQHSIIAEEEGEVGNRNSEFTWYIDPLDGTTNFAHGHPIYAISIALSYKNEIKMGVVYLPVLNWIYRAVKDQGACLNGESIYVSKINTIDNSLIATGYPYNRRTSSDDNIEETKVMIKNAQGLRRCGAASVDLCLVADGTYDGYWEKRMKPWDIAAGIIIVQEAGGMVTDEKGGKIELDGRTVVASNGKIHQQLIELLKLSIER